MVLIPEKVPWRAGNRIVEREVLRIADPIGDVVIILNRNFEREKKKHGKNPVWLRQYLQGLKAPQAGDRITVLAVPTSVGLVFLIPSQKLKEMLESGSQILEEREVLRETVDLRIRPRAALRFPETGIAFMRRKSQFSHLIS